MKSSDGDIAGALFQIVFGIILIPIFIGIPLLILGVINLIRSCLK
jgi:hypothetical protein